MSEAPQRESGATLRWPAEWEPHAATWLSWPHNHETWPTQFDAAERQYAAIAAALWGRETLEINVADEALEERARARLVEIGIDPDRGIRFHRIPTDDAWVRDHGPIFVVAGGAAGSRRIEMVDFRFDTWGGKYPPWDRDAEVPARVSEATGIPRTRCDEVLEGGSIDGNGLGAILTTRSCLLHANRGSDGVARTQEQAETLLAERLGARQVLWLEAGIVGDDTDGHVDDVARFVSASCIVAAIEANSSDANHAPLRQNLRRLRELRSLDGKPFDVVRLPMPAPIGAGGNRYPASHANFYLANGVALVPTFGGASDAGALAILEECLVGREIVGIPCDRLVEGLGAVHCLTQQQPR